MLACLSMFGSRARSGLGDVVDGSGFNWIGLYSAIAQDAGSGAATLGEISTMLLNMGLTVEAARGALNTVALNVGSNPQQLQAVNAELNYLNTYDADGLYTLNRNKWILPALVVGGLVWWAMQDKR